MLFHASIDAQDPRRVASVLAEIWRGTVLPFPVVPGSCIVLAGDERRSAIEIHTAGRVLIPGDDEAESLDAFEGPRATATHLAIGVSCSVAELERIAAREWWLCRTCERGGLFRVVEFWLENRVLLELLTPEMQAEYLANATPERLQQAFAAQGGAGSPRPLPRRMPAREIMEAAHG